MSGPVHHRYGEPRLVQLVVADEALIKGVWPCWVTQSWLRARPRPDAVDHGEDGRAALGPLLQSACMLASFVGSNWTIIGLILRPLMPPALLIWFT